MVSGALTVNAVLPWIADVTGPQSRLLNPQAREPAFDRGRDNMENIK
jgi:hypothetical protein